MGVFHAVMQDPQMEVLLYLVTAPSTWLQGHPRHQHQLAKGDERERLGRYEWFYGLGLAVMHAKPTDVLLSRIQSCGHLNKRKP